MTKLLASLVCLIAASAALAQPIVTDSTSKRALDNPLSNKD